MILVDAVFFAVGIAFVAAPFLYVWSAIRDGSPRGSGATGREPQGGAGGWND